MIKIGQASRDERGKYSGGKAGDQDGQEVAIRSWYNRPWNKILRAKNSDVAEKIAKAMEEACKNDNVGYDQYERTTLYELCKANDWNIKAVNNPCETDCSALVAVCVNAAGVKVSGDIYTGNEADVLLKTKEFELLEAPKYLMTDEYLRRGDILLYEFHHTAIALGNGVKSNIQIQKEVAFNVGWNKDHNGQWWYADTPNSRIVGKWAYIDKRWYVFDKAGKAIKGWFKSEDDWYYLNPADYAMLSGQWINIDSNSYYLQESGLMARDSYIKSKDKNMYYWVNSDGVYQKDFDTESPDLSKCQLAK